VFQSVTHWKQSKENLRSDDENKLMSDLPFFLHNVFFSQEIENIWYLFGYRNTHKVWKNSKMLWKHFYLWFVFHSIALTPKLLLVFLKLNKTLRFTT